MEGLAGQKIRYIQGDEGFGSRGREKGVDKGMNNTR